MSRFGKFLLGLWLVLVVLSYAEAHAQEANTAWEILIYNETEIVRVTPTGLGEPIALPQTAQHIGQNVASLNPLSISSDHRYLAFVTDVPGTGGSGIAPLEALQIADLQAGTCCVKVESPLVYPADVMGAGPFSADNTQFAAVFSRVYGQPTISAQLGLVDAATGEIIRYAPESVTGTALGVKMTTWDTDGITLFPSCFACGGALDGHYSRWNPETDEVLPANYVYSTIGDWLAVTGESLQAALDADFPRGTPGDGMFDPFNAIQYYASMDSDPLTVYHDPANLDLPFPPHWVADGNAYLLAGWQASTGVLVYRDGTRQTVELAPSMQFLVGTPDGWLMWDEALHYYRLRDGVVSVETLGLLDGMPRIVAAVPLGASVMGAVTPLIIGQG